MIKLTDSSEERLKFAIDLAWDIYAKRIAFGKTSVFDESTMQLHYAMLIGNVGELICINKKDHFEIQLEQPYKRNRIDIVCRYNEAIIAIELKCFRKTSRPIDESMYCVLRDIEKLLNYEGFQLKKFICLTDNPKYTEEKYHNGNASSVSIGNGVLYLKDETITPAWAGNWENKSKEKPINFIKDIGFEWYQEKDWYYLNMDL